MWRMAHRFGHVGRRHFALSTPAFAPQEGKGITSQLAKIAEHPMDIAGTEQDPSYLCFSHLRPWSQKETQKTDTAGHREHPAFAIVIRQVCGPDPISRKSDAPSVHHHQNRPRPGYSGRRVDGRTCGGGNCIPRPGRLALPQG